MTTPSRPPSSPLDAEDNPDADISDFSETSPGLSREPWILFLDMDKAFDRLVCSREAASPYTRRMELVRTRRTPRLGRKSLRATTLPNHVPITLPQQCSPGESGLYLTAAKPALLFLTETQISSLADTSCLSYPGYNLEHSFIPRAGVCVYVREDVCSRRLSFLEGQDLSIIWLRVDCDDHPRIYACLYRSHSGNAETDRLLEHIQMATDTVLEQIPTAEIVFLGDFNAHHAEWLGSRTTDHAGRSVHDFALAYGLTQLVIAPTRIPDVQDHRPSLLDLLLTSHPDGYLVSVDPPLGSSDHCLIWSTVPITRLTRPRFLGCRRVWHYRSAEWDEMRCFFASYPWRQICFSLGDPDAAADAVADVVLQVMELFIPSSSVPIGCRSQPWFDRSCKMASRRKQECYQID
ncbi:unnamed protein product [Leptidea sinapis]|uniref:Endonuclease/exonuclease/phosphatase domain-containing protein n=1 Tax=Leptidea sinapis TaxID=189913 RepID=A0A5E4PRU2_9NEOP|nr:unnamed protein product [Leptidea sinapis]